ncbi:tetratricopeptide repeat protein [Pseudoxanthomonas sp. NC8]|nr:tetratricopeptide repeat protein [Pseudoxanthomonas sp. NC8]
MRTGELAAAEPLLGHALQVWSSRLEPDAKDVLITRLGMAEWQVRSGRFAAAHAALDALGPLLADKPPQLQFRHQSLLAELLQREGRPQQAVQAWRQAVAMAEAQYGSDTISTARHRVPLAEALLDAGHPVQAREQMLRAAPLLREQLVPDSELPLRLTRLESRLGSAPAHQG